MRSIRRTRPETEARWLGEIRSIATRVLAPHDVTLYLFGSRARGDARLASDIDLAIDSKSELPPSIFTRLADEFDESTVPVRVQVIDLRAAGGALREKVLAEGVRWIASKSA